MIDILNFSGNDIQVAKTTTQKGVNILKAQLGSLEYAPEIGIDLDFFLQEGILFQNEAFRAYILKRLAESSVDVVSTISVINDFIQNYTINLSPIAQEGKVK